MTVYVAVEVSQGVVTEISVFKKHESVEKAEQEWLKEHGVTDDAGREAKAQNGTEFIVQKCEVKP